LSASLPEARDKRGVPARLRFNHCELESSYGESRRFIAPNLEAPYSGRTMMGEL
jgi:hypothetical protein